jgi:hypothetical protein
MFSIQNSFRIPLELTILNKQKKVVDQTDGGR